MGSTTVDSRILARALGWLFVAGATIGAISLLLPHPADADEVGLWSNVAITYAGGVVLLAVGHRFPDWLFHATLATGTLLVTRAVYLSGEAVSFYSVWFLWIGLVAFYFFNRRAAAAHVAFVSVMFAATVIDEPGSSPVARWLTTVTTLVVAGVLIDTLVRRARADAAAAARSARSMTMVAEMAHELARLSDSAAAGPALCQAARRLARALAVSLWVPTPEGASLALAASAGASPSQRALPFVGPPAGALNAFTTAECVRAEGAAEVSQLAPELTGESKLPGTALWQPVLRDGVAVAVLAFYWSAVLDDEEAVLTLTDLLAAEASVTLERVNLLSRLETVARTDDLTGLPNRRAWQEELPREIGRARREGTPLCVAMLDLDHFKVFNDENGHQAGDRLLKQAAAAWIAQLRGTDILARYGGEEFALALPVCPAEEALTVVERLRAVTPEGQTCSAGVVCWDGSESAADLVGRADAALYEAKNAGRDRTVVSLTATQSRSS